jgi:glycosyltransferase involved in cell wall biosynthesis
MSPILTIVTIVKDDASGFRRTADSIDRSDRSALERIEWVVIDGSQDRDAIPDLLTNVHRSARYEWSEPAGVFEAMNAGLDRALGQYIYFLNAGDSLRNEESLSHLLEIIRRDEPVWVFGQVAFVDGRGQQVIPPPFDYEKERSALFARGRFPPHQGTVVRTESLRAVGGFDTQYQITADYTLMLRLSQLAKPVQTVDVLAEFTTGGISDRRWLLALNEFHRARLEVFRPSGIALAREFADTASNMIQTVIYRTLRK